MYQRGIYPESSFNIVQQYGLTLLMSKDEKIEAFLKNVLTQVEGNMIFIEYVARIFERSSSSCHFAEWVATNLVEKISLIITNAHSREVLECWEFKVENEGNENDSKVSNGDAINNTDPKNPTSSKDLHRIQLEIRDVMRQISATITYLPLLDCICSFDILLHTLNGCEIPENFNETADVQIQNAQAVELKSFSTGLHKMQTIVNYKMKL